MITLAKKCISLVVIFTLVFSNLLIPAVKYAKADTASIPTADPVAGTYGSTQEVSLSSDSDNGVYYTLDSSDPTCPTDNSATVDDVQNFNGNSEEQAGNYDDGQSVDYTIFAYKNSPVTFYSQDRTDTQVIANPDGAIHLSWDQVDGADGYIIFRLSDHYGSGYITTTNNGFFTDDDNRMEADGGYWQDFSGLGEFNSEFPQPRSPQGGTIQGNGTLYDGPIEISEDTTLKAIGCESNSFNSTVAQFDYVIDTEAPTIDSVHIESNNIDPTVADLGDVVTINFTTSEPIQSPTVNIDSTHDTDIGDIHISGSGTNWTATTTMTLDDDTGNSPIFFSIAPPTDLAGNQGSDSVSETTDDSVVTSLVDSGPLRVDDFSMVSNRLDGTFYAEPGDQIMISFTTSKNVNTPVVTMLDRPADTVTQGEDARHWTASTTLTWDDIIDNYQGYYPNYTVDLTDAYDDVFDQINQDTNGPLVSVQGTYLSQVTIGSSNDDSTIAVPGDTVTLDFYASEPLNTPTVTIGSHSGDDVTVTSLDDGGGYNWEASTVMTTDDNNGAVPFDITYTNPTDNPGLEATTTTDDTFITYDKSLTHVILVDPEPATIGPNDIGGGFTVYFTYNHPMDNSTEPVVTMSPDLTSSDLFPDGPPLTLSDQGWGDDSTYYVTYNVNDGAEATSTYLDFFLDGTGVHDQNDMDTESTTSVRIMNFNTIVPTIESLHVSSNNTTNTSYARTGDVVTMNFTSNVPLDPSTLLVLIGNHCNNENSCDIESVNPVTLLDLGGGTSWSASTTMQVDDPEDIVSSYVSDGYDLFGTQIQNLGAGSTDDSSVTFDITPPDDPSVDIPGDTYDGDQAVTITTSDPDTIQYTLDGTDPTCSTGTLYTDPVTINTTETLKAIACDAAGNFSNVVGNDYVINHPPMIDTLHISSNNSNTSFARTGDVVTIDFTSSVPLDPAALTVYIGSHCNTADSCDVETVNPVTLLDLGGGTSWSAFTTMQAGDGQGAVSVDISGGGVLEASNTTDDSSVTFDITAPSDPTSNVTPGQHYSEQTVSLSTSGSDTIHYTTSGVDPTCSSGTLYAGAITVASSETIKAIACDAAGNVSSVASFAYIISQFIDGYNWTETRPAGDTNKFWTHLTSDSSGQHLMVSAPGGRIYTSSDSGSTWTERRPAGDSNQTWQLSGQSSDGNVLMAGIDGGRLYISTNGGVDWTETRPAGNADKSWDLFASDATGLKLIVGVQGGGIYISNDHGSSWSLIDPTGHGNSGWHSAASSADGSHLFITNETRLYISTNGGVDWTETRPLGDTNQQWRVVSSSADGSHLLAGNDHGLYLSTNGGTDWAETMPAGPTSRDWYVASSNSDGSVLMAGANGGRLYISTNGGTNWTETMPTGDTNKFWRGATSNSDGTKLAAIVYTGRVYVGVPAIVSEDNGGGGDSGGGNNNNNSGGGGNSGGGSSGGGGWSPIVPIVPTLPIVPPPHVVPLLVSPLPAGLSTTHPPYTFTKNLSLGNISKDVQNLQKFLNTHGFPVAKKGAGSPGHETTWFGPATKLALIKFQKAHHILPATGALGPQTLRYLKSIGL